MDQVALYAKGASAGWVPYTVYVSHHSQLGGLYKNSKAASTRRSKRLLLPSLVMRPAAIYYLQQGASGTQQDAPGLQQLAACAPTVSAASRLRILKSLLMGFKDAS